MFFLNDITPRWCTIRMWDFKLPLRLVLYVQSVIGQTKPFSFPHSNRWWLYKDALCLYFLKQVLHGKKKPTKNLIYYKIEKNLLDYFSTEENNLIKIFLTFAKSYSIWSLINFKKYNMQTNFCDACHFSHWLLELVLGPYDLRIFYQKNN